MRSVSNDELQLVEYLTPSDRIEHSFERVLVDRHTAFQHLQICESATQGKVLLLDGTWQSCTRDEFIYHEALVHPAMLACAQPRSVLILGGGEGATAREVLRWSSVQRVVMVDIDAEVVEACREHLPEMHGGAFDDPRLQLRVTDALELLNSTDERWDVVISDLSDPLEEGPSFQLFTQEYFSKARRVLAPGGAFVVQAGTVGPAEVDKHARLHATVAACWEHTESYQAFVPSFGTPWSFILAARNALASPNPTIVDRRIERSTTGRFGWLSGDSLLASRLLPPYLRRAIDDPRVQPYTLADPPKFGT